MIRLESILTVTDPRKIFSYMLTCETRNGYGVGGGERRRAAKDRLSSTVNNQVFRKLY